jgi:hypothetical protein
MIFAEFLGREEPPAVWIEPNTIRIINIDKKNVLFFEKNINSPLQHYFINLIKKIEIVRI